MPSIQLSDTTDRNGRPVSAWRDSVVVLEQLLAEAKLDGEFTLRPVRQVRWNVQANGRGAVKLLHVHNHALMLRVRPPKADNGGVWEYALQPPRGLDPLSVLAGCTEALDRWHHPRAAVGSGLETPAAPAPEPQEVNLLDLFARLQRARERSRERTRQLAAIDQQRQALQAEVRELHEAIGELDQEELRVLAAAETDGEADQAEKVLDALQGMLAGKEARS